MFVRTIAAVIAMFAAGMVLALFLRARSREHYVQLGRFDREALEEIK